MKFHDIVSLAQSTPEFLQTADACMTLEHSDPAKMKWMSEVVLSIQKERRKYVIAYLAKGSFSSMSLLGRAVTSNSTNIAAARVFFNGISDDEMDTPAGRVLRDKLRLFYALKLISSAFNDQYLVNLKKAFKND